MVLKLQLLSLSGSGMQTMYFRNNIPHAALSVLRFIGFLYPDHSVGDFLNGVVKKILTSPATCISKGLMWEVMPSKVPIWEHAVFLCLQIVFSADREMGTVDYRIVFLSPVLVHLGP